VVETRTTRCHKFIQVSVITMLLGDVGREAGGTFARYRPHMAMCQSDFRSACIGSSQTAVRLFSMNRPILNTSMCKLYPLLRAGNLVNTAKEVKPPCYIYHFSPKFSLGLSKMLNHVRYRVGLDMKYF